MPAVNGATTAGALARLYGAPPTRRGPAAPRLLAAATVQDARQGPGAHG